MKKILLGIIVLAVIGGTVWLLSSRTNEGSGQPKTNPTPPPSSTDSSSKNDSKPAEVMINIKDFAFETKHVTVKKGSKVTWTNQDTVKHDVMSDANQSEGGPSGPLLGKGESYSFTFNTVGTFGYHCTPHPYMKASVTVTE